MTTARPRQFSLRLLMLVVLGCCLLLGAWRLWGEVAIVFAGFAAMLAVPVMAVRSTWLGAWLVGELVVYGPFAAMATYTLIYVDCSHCKQTAWLLLPPGPGMFPIEIARSLLDLPRPEDQVWFALGFAIAAALVAGVAWLIRTRRWWWSVPVTSVVLSYSAWAAFALLSVIQA